MSSTHVCDSPKTVVNSYLESFTVGGGEPASKSVCTVDAEQSKGAPLLTAHRAMNTGAVNNSRWSSWFTLPFPLLATAQSLIGFVAELNEKIETTSMTHLW